MHDRGDSLDVDRLRLVTHVTEPEAKRVLVEFFRNVYSEVYNRESFRDLITDDFHIYEAGKHMSRSEFFEFIESTHSEATLSND